jgi:hypothetical protein
VDPKVRYSTTAVCDPAAGSKYAEVQVKVHADMEAGVNTANAVIMTSSKEDPRLVTSCAWPAQQEHVFKMQGPRNADALLLNARRAVDDISNWKCEQRRTRIRLGQGSYPHECPGLKVVV